MKRFKHFITLFLLFIFVTNIGAQAFSSTQSDNQKRFKAKVLLSQKSGNTVNQDENTFIEELEEEELEGDQFTESDFFCNCSQIFSFYFDQYKSGNTSFSKDQPKLYSSLEISLRTLRI